jgi:hypothetical protein
MRISWLLLCLFGACLAWAAELPTCVCKHVDRDLVLTGKADDPLWATAETVRLSDADTGAKPAYDTTVRMLWSNKYLYIAFACEDPLVRTNITQHDGELFTQDVTEVFLAPTGCWRNYFEIEVNPLNVTLDSFMLNQSNPDGSYRRIQFLGSYDCWDLRSKVAIDGEMGKPGAKGWSAEYAIPFMSLEGPDNIVPKPGDRWRANFCRIDVGAGPEMTFHSWSPLGFHDFHRAYRFGWMVFK